ncbi:MAG: 1-deoxy-D-xylulose-5-phosphate reductoisomerase [Chloroflexi bacterium]|nr:1-deoxy-D-xylulose-5-phosphate reductoisomerase [Chloroflexota bacterium]|tara:strand:- start:4415 stop:5533 length:1119 start_codon:yes stop_codon:yes gene_type:complete
MKRKISILGSTGSVGTQCLDLIEENLKDFELITITAGINEKKLEEQVNKFKPKYYYSKSDLNYSYGKRLNNYQDILKFDDSDLIVIALSGVEGIDPTIFSLEQGRKVLLANKESLVVGGDIIVELSKDNGGEIIPLDSEHSAIWQCIKNEDYGSIDRVILTASGGALRDRATEELKKITVDDVLAHPTWKMGKKITVDSSTLINKVFEVQEASNLFSLPLDKIEVLFHRQSLIHGLAEFNDGNILAVLSYPDMKIPILYGLYYPERKSSSKIEKIDFRSIESLSFESFPEEKLGWFNFGMQLLNSSKLAPSFLVGSDQAAVEMFLEGKVSYTGMLDAMKRVYERFDFSVEYNLETIKETVQRSYIMTLKEIE